MVERLCEDCGKVTVGGGRRCSTCRMRIWRARNPAQAAAKDRQGHRRIRLPWPGGCALCGGTERLHAHHVIRGSKPPCRGRSSARRSEAGVREERLRYCVPLCRRCHEFVHAVRPRLLWGVLGEFARWDGSVLRIGLPGGQLLELSRADLVHHVLDAANAYATYLLVRIP